MPQPRSEKKAAAVAKLLSYYLGRAFRLASDSMVRRSVWREVIQERRVLTISRNVAREDLCNQVDTITEDLGVARTTAQRYIPDERITEVAEHTTVVAAGRHSAIASGDVADLDAKRAPTTQ